MERYHWQECQKFYQGKRVLLTGHTGFKGAWLSRILQLTGARVDGYATDPPTAPSLFRIADIGEEMESVRGDIRDFSHLRAVFSQVKPEIVFHLAAQPIVRESYKNPVLTYETNVMGTVHVLECVRLTPTVRSFLNVTTDKVYENREWEYGYREIDPLGGFDPYSNSKACSELVTQSYRKSFSSELNGEARSCAISTARAGNVIGGGDFAADRLIPDCVRAAAAGKEIIVRNPHSTRPFQHVLEPLFAYLMIAQRQYEQMDLQGNYNVGPEDGGCLAAGELAEMFCELWGEGLKWAARPVAGPHEAGLLRLDCARIEHTFGWKPVWGIREALKKTVEWSKEYLAGGEMKEVMDRQIAEYCNDLRNSLPTM